MKMEPVLLASMIVIAGLASLIAYTDMLRPLRGNGQLVEPKGRFNVVWIGNGSASDVTKRFFLTDVDGGRTSWT